MNDPFGSENGNTIHVAEGSRPREVYAEANGAGSLNIINNGKVYREPISIPKMEAMRI